MGCGGSKPQASTVVAVSTKDPDAPTEVTKKEVSTKTKVRTIRYEDKVKRIVETTVTYDDGTTSTSATEQEYTIEDAERLFGVGPGGNASKTAAADITPEEAMAVSQAVLTEMTRIRAEPELYVAKLQELKSRMQGNVVFLPNRPPFTLKEGPAAFDEAISFLQQQKPLVELTWSAGLARACMDHVKDVGPKGALTHEGSDGCDFEDRLKRYGDYNGRVAENLAFSRFTAEDIVLYWLLSDGEPTRQQRKTLFDPIFTTAGVYYGTHANATAMCCALLAFSYHENKEGQKAVEGLPTAPVAPPASS